jgi:hypothetical protein
LLLLSSNQALPCLLHYRVNVDEVISHTHFDHSVNVVDTIVVSVDSKHNAIRHALAKDGPILGSSSDVPETVKMSQRKICKCKAKFCWF